MISKIICPTDFSSAATNAVEYAANLAKLLNADLLFVNVQRMTPVEAVLSLEEDGGVSAQSILAADKLKEICDSVNETFGISSSYKVGLSAKSLADMFSSYEEQTTMIAMGTNGIDDLYQFFFGTNTYELIKKAKCSVLVIPENTSYQPIKKVVFAADYHPATKISFALLEDVYAMFDPQFYFLHVSTDYKKFNDDAFKELHTETVVSLSDKVQFEQIYSDDIPESISNYVIKLNADLLTIVYYNRGWIPNLFHGKVAEILTETASFPILVLHA
jgi:nucleotide-binding universal stress UspA family protein